ncbi:MAG: response regulator [Chloroflexota bacterium]
MPKRVLVVEDERDVAELVSTVLSMEGFEAYISSGPQALADALSFQPDVVLLDLMMPEVDGFEVARRLRAHQVTEGLPIVVMTAMHDAALRAKQIGTELFLPKPFDINELVRIVEEAALA